MLLLEPLAPLRFLVQLRHWLFRLADVALHMTSSYHPQSDGQTERLNQTMETFLRCFVNVCPSKWLNWLSLAEFWYNTSEHSAIKRTTFSALYGHEAKHFGISAVSSVAVPELETWMMNRQVMNELIKQHLHRSKARIKKQADHHRSERQFTVVQMVFLKLQPYVQSSVAPRANQKLSYRYFGPFKILQRVGNVAYKLLLPQGSAVHPVFRVSQLKEAILNQSQVSATLPPDLDLLSVPEKILQRRMGNRDTRQVPQVLMKLSS
jgi:hypothetical protein